jgi:hypothetical protein
VIAISRATDPVRLPLVRVRHPCRDAAEFRARFAAAVAAQGIFVPTRHPRPAGARVELVVELRDGTALRGEALAVDSAVQGSSGPGLTFRFVRLFEGSLDLEAPAPAAAPSVAATAASESFQELFTPEEQRELLQGGGVVEESPQGVESEDTLDVPLRGDVVELRSAADEEDRRREAGARRRRARLAAGPIVAVAVAVLAAYLAVARHAELEIDAHVSSADERFADGRLSGGGDSALDHLVAARSLRPHDPAVRERLRLVADKLEELADRALARGDYVEAAVHLAAATQAEPERKRLHVRLGEIVRIRGPRLVPPEGAPDGQARPRTQGRIAGSAE